jgi:hypothetical protein
MGRALDAAARMSQASTESSGAPASGAVPRLRWLLGAYLFAIFCYFGPGATWSPVSRFCLTRAIVERKTFEITEFAPSTGDRAKRDGRFYSDKAPLPSLMAVPAYAAFHALARWRGRLPGLSGGRHRGPTGHARRRQSGVSRGALDSEREHGCTVGRAARHGDVRGAPAPVCALHAVSATLATLLGTPLLPYAASFFGHTIAAALLFGAFSLLDPLATSSAARPRSTVGRAIGAGLALAAAVGTEYVSAVLALALLAYFVAIAPRGARWQRLGLLVLGAALPLFVVAAYHQACFGAPWRTGYSFIVRSSFAQGHAQGLLGVTYPRPAALWGTLFGSSRGVFYIAPISAVAVSALAIGWWNNRDRERLIAIVCVVSLLVVNASYYMWWGGWATGPRHAVAGFGFLALGVAAAFEWRGYWRALAVALALVSVLLMIFTTAVGLEAPPERDAIFEYLLPALREGRIARLPGAGNLGMVFGLSRRISVLPLIFWTAFGAFWLLERVVPREPSPERATPLP